jgi:predicted DNA-binding transcriptional regulator AlpA
MVLSSAMSEVDELLTTAEAAALLKIDVKALYWLRYTRNAPKARKIGRELRFLRSDVIAWIIGHPAS